MAIENRKLIGSITEAMLIAKKSNGVIPIAPCTQVGPEGKTNTCPNSSKTLLCTYEEGVLTDGKTVLCPKQKGVLTLINTSVIGDNSSNGASQEPRVQTLTKPLALDRKERRPYFVR